LVKSYLSNRSQDRVVNGASSESPKITCGVPQACVLEPLLFLIYVNDLSNAVENNLLKLFAYDTNLFLYSDNMCELEAIGQS